MKALQHVNQVEITWSKIRYLSSLVIKQLSENDLENTQKVKRLESRGLPIVHHHGYVCDLPIKHRFAMKKFHGVIRHLRKDNVVSSKQIVEPNLLDPEVFKVVHSSQYIDRFMSGQTTATEQRKTGFQWTEGIVSRVRYETAGTLLAAKLALERGIACSTGGGTHHAFPDHGSGYCLVNDLAVTAMSLVLTGSVHRVVVVDLDVHQGDGTAFIFSDNSNIYTFSMHNENNFPFPKKESDIDIGLKDRMEDKEYMNILTDILPWILDHVKPDLVLYDAGVDPHEKDELGRLKLTDQGLFDRDFYVIDSCHRQGIPVATVIGGGYQRDLNALTLRHTIVHRAASKIWNGSLVYKS
ncbi:uncharacterized protein SYNPCC7002_A1628-like [Mytilus trossulus]|uniref:uncharacterized protein SYNPCC7002_A1628-like n=1 Tax=Mytilus trossulus TaxID=6551 RepID=UPI0030057B46